MLSLLDHMRLNPDEGYKNRSPLREGEAFCFDGYSQWYYGTPDPLRVLGTFSLSFVCLPYGYSSRGDGIFSCLDSAECKGLAIRCLPYDLVEVRLGLGRECFSFTSLDVRLRKDAWNAVTVVFRQEDGWCDLYVNGKMANRQQFRRGLSLIWPDTSMYVGKYIDLGERYVSIPRERTVEKEEPLGASVPMGCFWGKLLCATITEGAFLPGWPVENLPLAGGAVLDRSFYDGDADRPAYHLIPPGRWMNEPHAPFFYKGLYHIFYQANPHAPVWDNIQWGHMVSPDMVWWRDLPLALETEEERYDAMGIWSGSAVIDRKGMPRIYYTAGDGRRFPNQAVAMAIPESGDRELARWVKHETLVKVQDIGWRGEFRDPFVWFEEGEYFMLVGTGDEAGGGGNAALYVSPDGISWECTGLLAEYDFAANPEVGHVWELPVLLPVKDREGRTACHILLLCACQIDGDIVETYYFLGDWNPKERHFSLRKDGHGAYGRAQLLDLGHGYFTGPSGFVTPDGRTVLFSITQEHRPFLDQYHSGYAHNGGLPIELWWEEGLRIGVIRELARYESEPMLALSGIGIAQANDRLRAFSGNRLHLSLIVKGDDLAITVRNCRESKNIRIDRGAGRIYVFGDDGQDVSRYRGDVDRLALKGDEKLFIDLYVDHSMIEFYINHRKSVTLRNYAMAGERALSLDGAGEIEALTLTSVAGVYEEEKGSNAIGESYGQIVFQ